MNLKYLYIYKNGKKNILTFFLVNFDIPYKSVKIKNELEWGLVGKRNNALFR